MKILYILHSTDNDGSTISFLKMVEGISHRGVNFVVVIPSLNYGFEQKIAELGGKCVQCKIIHSVITPSPDKLKQIWLSFKLVILKIGALIKLYRIVKQETPDIIHTNTGTVHEGFFCAKINKIPHVWHLREYQDKDFGLRPFPTKGVFSGYLKKSYVISITKGILNHFNLEENFAHRTIYNGIFSREQTSFQVKNRNYFLCASRVSPEKGLECVITSFARFHKEFPDYKLTICGFGDETYITLLKELCVSQNIQNAVEFSGFKIDIANYMRHAKALIVGSYNEGFGRMTAEAAFCGCLVIGRNTAGTKEIMDEVGGLPFLTDDELVLNMIRLAQMDADEYKQLAVSAQKKAELLYSTEKNVESIYGFYKDILGRGR